MSLATTTVTATSVLSSDIWKQYRAVFGQIFPACSGYAVRCPLFPEDWRWSSPVEILLVMKCSHMVVAEYDHYWLQK